MNKCLKCGKIYQDQTLFFCLEDGEKLVPFEPSFLNSTPTVVVNPNPTAVSQPTAAKSNLSFYVRWITVGVLLFISAIAGLVFIAMQMTPSSNINYSIPNKTTKTEEAKPSEINESSNAVTKNNPCDVDLKKYFLDDFSDLEFRVGSSELIEESRDNLGTTANNLKELNLPVDCLIEIGVNNNQVKSPSDEKNSAQARLNKSRAEEIKKWLVKYGINADKIKTRGDVYYKQANNPSTADVGYHVELKIKSAETIQNERQCSSTLANC